ncbi:MAG: hypothetical protein ACYDA5_02680 [Vulcanimicrobiaceae bacterium]
MPNLHVGEGGPLVDRVRLLASAFAQTDLVGLCIQREGEEIELRRRPRSEGAALPDGAPAGAHRETIAADLVGIFRLSRPAPVEGERLTADRELAYVEALGIRNPVRSLGEGLLVRIAARDGAPVDYGAALFEIDRG